MKKLLVAACAALSLSAHAGTWVNVFRNDPSTQVDIENIERRGDRLGTRKFWMLHFKGQEQFELMRYLVQCKTPKAEVVGLSYQHYIGTMPAIESTEPLYQAYEEGSVIDAAVRIVCSVR